MRWSLPLLALLALANAAGEPAIRLKVSPKIAQAPSWAHALIFITPDPRNRLLVVSLESDGYSLRSDRTLAGDQAPRVVDVWWKDLPCGLYTVRAVAGRTDGQSQAADGFRLLGIACPAEDGE